MNDIDINKYPFRYHHDACGKTAFYMRKTYKVGEKPEAKNVIFPNGDIPEVGDACPPKCGSCGEQIHRLYVEYIREIKALEFK